MALCFGNSGLEFLMKFIEVYNQIFCTGRSYVSFRMDGDVRVVSFVGKEWGDTGSSTRGIVIGEFSKGKECVPIVLLVVAENV